MVYLQVVLFAAWALQQVVKWTGKTPMPVNCRPHFANLMQLCSEVFKAGALDGVQPSSEAAPEPMLASEPIIDRESLRRAVVAGDDWLISGFLTARFLSASQRQVLESGMSLIQEDQEPTNGFLDQWLAKYKAM